MTTTKNFGFSHQPDLEVYTSSKGKSVMNYKLCMQTIMSLIFIFLHFFILLYFNTFKQPSSILKSLFWEKQEGVEAAESGKNSINESKIPLVFS